MTDELRHFLLLVEAGTFTAAARAAHLSQPALSASIARLERWAGAPLLERRVGRAAGPGALLTPAGRALLPRARAVLAALADGQRAVGEVMGLVVGEVNIGAGATLCTYVLPRLLPGFARAHPGLVLKLSEQTAAETRRGIDAGSLDLGLVTETTGDPWIADSLVLVASPRHEVIKARKGLTPGTPLVTFPPGGTTRALLEQHFSEARVVMELSGVAAVVAFVRAGAGVALVSRDAVASELRRGQLSVLKDRRTPIARPIHIVHRGLERLTPAAAALRQYLLEQAPAAYPRR